MLLDTESVPAFPLINILYLIAHQKNQHVIFCDKLAIIIGLLIL